MNLIKHSTLTLGFFIVIYTAQAQWTTSGTNIYSTNTGNTGIGISVPLAKLHVYGNAIIGDGTTGSVSVLTIKGPNTANSTSYQDINYSFASAGSTRIRSYRGNSWDTYLEFLTNLSSAGKDNPSVVMHLDATGNVGIGTTSPQYTLDVNGTGVFGNGAVNTNSTKILLRNSYGKTWGLSSGENMINEVYFGIYDWTDNSSMPYFTVTQIGTIGIGVVNPTDKLEVSGTVTLQSGGNLNLRSSGTDPGDIIFQASDLTEYGRIYSFSDQMFISAGTNVSPEITITGSTGQVLIGSNASGKAATGYKFAVNGDALFTKAVVKNYTNWPDYVFDSAYTLQDLPAVEHFIKTNNHLPGIPTAGEVAENGIDVAGTQAALLKKIEELTLYVIEQNKKQAAQDALIKEQALQLAAQQQTAAEQQVQLKTLYDEISVLKNKIHQ